MDKVCQTKDCKEPIEQPHVGRTRRFCDRCIGARNRKTTRLRRLQIRLRRLEDERSGIQRDIAELEQELA
jgi:hypothetical protein